MKKGKKNINLIYDVGMHKGEDTEFYLKKGFDVVAFEANPDLVLACQKKFKDEISNGHLVIVEGAIVGGKNKEPLETVYFYRNKENSVWGTVVDDWENRNKMLGKSSEVIKVRTIDFSEYLEKYGIPYYLKIDIEGMDTVCLECLLDFEEKPNFISIESEKENFSNLNHEVNLFTENGYTAFQAVQQETIPAINLKSPSSEGRDIVHEFPEGSSGPFGRDLSGQWVDKNEILSNYQRIFREYRLFGDYGLFTKTRLGRFFKRRVRRILGRPLPGWYDTHARQSSVSS
jgi:FkbM family methyltransferase